MRVSVAAFYHFVPLPDPASLKAPLLDLCRALGLTGTILLAPEGINGTVAGTATALDGLLDALRRGPLFNGRLGGLCARRSAAMAPPFGRMKVRLKREIVTLGRATDPHAATATFVEPEDWNALMARPGIALIDTRNAFEVAAGTFPGAIDPGLDRFGAFPDFVSRALDPARDRAVALFCTGGIRCEKASAYLIDRGFAEVYQLRGGILRYLEAVPAPISRWTGACFVFDGRVALGHGLAEVPDALRGAGRA